MSENSKSRKIRLQTDISDRVVVPCCECVYAIYVSKDPLSGKPRWHCGNDIWEIGAFGDLYLMSDNGCEFGKHKENKV